MSALLSSLLSSPMLLAIVAAVLGSLGWGFSQRRAGARAERDRQAQQRQEASDIARRIDDAVDSQPAEKTREELKTWSTLLQAQDAALLQAQDSRK